jgi:hypothetical protein
VYIIIVIVKLADLEAEMKNWITGHRGNGIYSTEIVIFEVRRWVGAHVVMGFAGAAGLTDF